MKKLIILALLAVMMAGCNDEIFQRRYAKSLNGDSFAVFEFDSCEYIIRNTPYCGYLAHKGNCKYCEARRKAEWKELVECIKTEKK